MDDKIKKYLLDINESVASIEEFLGNARDFKPYQNNKMLKRAVECEFEIIWGTIIRHLPILKTEIDALISTFY